MNLTQFAEWLIEAYHSDDGMPEAKEICREARAALSAQPVEGAVATDESGWLIEHSGEILPGAEQRAQVSWLRVQMKFNGYGAREFGFTHDANEALRFSRREDAEAVLAMHLGASPPDWYSKPFSVTEHMWPAASQAQAAPAPDPSAQAVAGAVATEPSEEIQELRAQVEAWRKQCETLTNQVICCGVAARHPDATLTTRGAYAGKWNSPQAEEVRKLRAERDALLANQPIAPTTQANVGLGNSRPKRFLGGRVIGGCSLHDTEKPELCQKHLRSCPEPRTVDCCGVVEERDIVECSRCGKQWSVPCNFDQDYS